MKLTGGCHCGAVRYETEADPFDTTFCHCADCRRIAGAPLVAWFSVPVETFRFVKGMPRRYASSARVDRGFCADCGTPLTYRHLDHSLGLDITTASLDDPSLVPPRDHVFFASRVPWMVPGDKLRRYATTRKAG